MNSATPVIFFSSLFFFFEGGVELTRGIVSTHLQKTGVRCWPPFVLLALVVVDKIEYVLAGRQRTLKGYRGKNNEPSGGDEHGGDEDKDARSGGGGDHCWGVGVQNWVVWWFFKMGRSSARGVRSPGSHTHARVDSLCVVVDHLRFGTTDKRTTTAHSSKEHATPTQSQDFCYFYKFTFD